MTRYIDRLRKGLSVNELSIELSKYYVDLHYGDKDIVRYIFVKKWVAYEEFHRVRAKIHHQITLLAIL